MTGREIAGVFLLGVFAGWLVTYKPKHERSPLFWFGMFCLFVLTYVLANFVPAIVRYL
jgi:hypothetical protein